MLFFRLFIRVSIAHFGATGMSKAEITKPKKLLFRKEGLRRKIACLQRGLRLLLNNFFGDLELLFGIENQIFHVIKFVFPA